MEDPKMGGRTRFLRFKLKACMDLSLSIYTRQVEKPLDRAAVSHIQNLHDTFLS